jgi:hypothetical protein
MTQDEQKKIIIETLQKNPLIEAVCAKAGISRRTFYRWKEEDQEFARAADEAQFEGKELVNDAAEGQVINKVKTGSLQGAIFWLKHNKKEYRNTLEVVGSMKIEDGRLSPEEEEIVKEALRGARSLPENQKIQIDGKPTASN